MTRIMELTAIISTNTEKMDRFFVSQNKPTPSFDVDSPDCLDIPDELQASRELVIDATTELKEVLQGPKQLLMSNSSNQLISLHAIYHYNMAEAFPVGSESTFLEISELCALNELDVRRILRLAMAHRIFREPRKGIVAHTQISKMLAETQQTVPAMARWTNSDEPTPTGFSIANNTEDSLYAELEKNPKRAARFGQGMSATMTNAGYELHHLVDYGLWASMKGGLVVDLGGSHGDAMIALARRYPSLKFIVQDIPSTIHSRPPLPLELQDQVSFMPHDFFTEQPVKNADVYYFRWIFHNWSDGYCIRIIRSLIPALKHQSRVIINDVCLPEPNTPGSMVERRLRSMDVSMLQIQNSREREQ